MHDFDERDGHSVPVTVLTGFLGAGKTTLLNRILQGDHGLQIAVMVNDFGSVNIDAELVVGMRDEVISLANGCICCQINDDLIEAIGGLVDGPHQPEYIVLEASGVADPAALAMTLTLPRFRDQIRLDSVIALVDADQLLARPECQDLKLRQIAYSDLLVLNKIDLLDEARLACVKSWLGDRFGSVRIIETRFADLPLEILLSVGRFDPARVAEPPVAASSHRHGHGFSTVTYASDDRFSVKRLRRLVRTLPETVYRMKGVLCAADDPTRRTILQAVGQRADIALADPWGDRPARTRIVAIGAPGSLDEVSLFAELDACRVVEADMPVS